ncbi:2-amino-4-hydroxy-6-hydroxymethyldihydropteridine diphosphokinase [Erythrobacter sp. HKB08]|uniref:2-amino-4-hydroxy-6- hydroxymethyldihydropteridine diphosphokinase n=1 Tax=Erythrobacter sp. HKB08 TaxID=2502843 RepID=UPI00100874E0|nr:2-amino-4-hydroxy-6-hydroxymethyldihydropteridine diphosphokinase [Erythrobacter sp. HKB08]
MSREVYLLALGSNRRHHRHGDPQRIVRQAVVELAELGDIAALSPIIASDPVGPSDRRFANAAALLHTDLDPRELLGELKRIERSFGRRRGPRWGARVIDLDIVLWSGGVVAEPDLMIPHLELHRRDFVLGPAKAIAPRWRDPISGLTIRQLDARLTKRRRAPR